MLLEALVGEFFIPVYRLGLAFHELDALAAEVVEETFCSVLLNRYRFPADAGVRSWVYSLALSACRSIQPDNAAASTGSRTNNLPTGKPGLFSVLPADRRLALVLHGEAGLSFVEIAALLQDSSDVIEKGVSRALEDLEIDLSPDPSAERVATLGSFLELSLPVPELDETRRHNLTAAVEERLTRHNARQKRSTSLKEVLFVMVAILGVLGIMGGSNLLFPEPEITPTPPGRTVVVVTQIVEVYVTSTPQPTATPNPPAGQAALPERPVYYAAERDETLQMIAERLRLDLARLLEYNNLTRDEPLHEGQLVIVGTQPPPTPAAVTVYREPSGDPLTTRTDSERILERIRTSRTYWTRLWIDGLIVEYGPPGYIGQPEIRRDQVWIHQAYNSLVLTGKPGENPDQIWFALNNKVYDVDLDTGRPFLYDFHHGDLPIYSDLADLVFPTRLIGDVQQVQVAGSVVVAGREALIIEWEAAGDTPASQAWVDVETGMVLGLRQYAPDGRTVVRLIVFTGLVVDPDLPNYIFDRGSLILQFARDYTGRVELSFHTKPVPEWIFDQGRGFRTHIDPPPAFDPALQELTFQWSSPEEYRAFEAQYQNRPIGAVDPFYQPVLVDLFAGQYFLGQVELNPWTAVCTRSPDGQAVAVAYSVQMSSSDGQASIRRQPVFYFSLNNPDNSRTTPENVIPQGGMAFSPDGRTLAFSGCSVSTRCGVYLWDSQSGEDRFLVLVGDAGSLVWSPDGQFLAMLGILPRSASYGLQVVRVSNGEIVYEAPFDPDNGELPAGAPVAAWEVRFPQFLVPGLTNCAEPPIF